MNKETYDQTVINFHTQLLVKEFTEKGISDTFSDRERVAGFVETATAVFVHNLNDTLAKRFLSDIRHKITPESTLNEVLEKYPNQFFNFRDGQRLIKDKANYDTDQFLQVCRNLGEEMTKIKNESSGIPPRLLDATKKNLIERFDVALDTFGATLSNYGQHNLDVGRGMIKTVLEAYSYPDFIEVTNGLLNEPILEKLMKRLKYEEAKDPNESKKYLCSFLEQNKARKIKP